MLIPRKRHGDVIEIAPNPCPECGSRMFVRPCPCRFARKGWATCAKCMQPKCAHVIGLTKKRPTQRVKRRKR